VQIDSARQVIRFQLVPTAIANPFLSGFQSLFDDAEVLIHQEPQNSAAPKVSENSTDDTSMQLLSKMDQLENIIKTLGTQENQTTGENERLSALENAVFRLADSASLPHKVDTATSPIDSAEVYLDKEQKQEKENLNSDTSNRLQNMEKQLDQLLKLSHKNTEVNSYPVNDNVQMKDKEKKYKRRREIFKSIENELFGSDESLNQEKMAFKNTDDQPVNENLNSVAKDPEPLILPYPRLM
jgi:DNA repair ATPase RecN